MSDAKRIHISGRAVPVRGNDIDTDRIIPARYLRCVTFDGLVDKAFEDDRAQLRAKGEIHAFDHADFQDAELLLVNKNFGCGSSREHAPQALVRWGRGIKAVVGESFAEIFFGNCTMMGVPCVTANHEAMHEMLVAAEADPTAHFKVDLEKMVVTCGDRSWPVAMPEGSRGMLVSGSWDTTAELVAAGAAIDATAARLPYVNHWK